MTIQALWIIRTLKAFNHFAYPMMQLTGKMYQFWQFNRGNQKADEFTRFTFLTIHKFIGYDDVPTPVYLYGIHITCKWQNERITRVMVRVRYSVQVNIPDILLTWLILAFLSGIYLSWKSKESFYSKVRIKTTFDVWSSY